MVATPRWRRPLTTRWQRTCSSLNRHHQLWGNKRYCQLRHVKSKWNFCIVKTHTIHDRHNLRSRDGHESRDLVAIKTQARMPILRFLFSCRDRRDICLTIQHCLQTQHLLVDLSWNIQYLPEVWERPREAYLESWFSWRSQKSIFSRGATKFFLEVAIMVGYFLNFFQNFISRGRASTNGSKSLGTCCRGLLEIGYFDGL